jgi:hypothetical protein
MSNHPKKALNPQQAARALVNLAGSKVEHTETLDYQFCAWDIDSGNMSRDTTSHRD